MEILLTLKGNRPTAGDESVSDGVLLGNNASLVSSIVAVEIDLRIQIPDGSPESVVNSIINDLTQSYLAKDWSSVYIQQSIFA